MAELDQAGFNGSNRFLRPLHHRRYAEEPIRHGSSHYSPSARSDISRVRAATASADRLTSVGAVTSKGGAI